VKGVVCFKFLLRDGQKRSGRITYKKTWLVFVYICWYQHNLLVWHHPKCTDTNKAWLELNIWWFEL